MDNRTLKIESLALDTRITDLERELIHFYGHLYFVNAEIGKREELEKNFIEIGKVASRLSEMSQAFWKLKNELSEVCTTLDFIKGDNV